MDQPVDVPSRREAFIAELLGEVTDPLHKRLLSAYGGAEPLHAMEDELRAILTEMVSHEA